MKKRTLSLLAGFVILFFFYHAAEYMILFENNSMGFLGFQVLFFISAYFIARQQAGTGFKAWGLGKWNGRSFLLGLLLGVILYGSSYVLALWTGSEKLVSIPALKDSWQPFALFFIGSLLSSFSEDVLTRGYVWHHSKNRLKPGSIVLLSSFIYVANHIYRLNDGIEPYIYLFALGLLYATALVKTRALWMTGAMHWAGNLSFFVSHQVWQTEEAGGGFSPNLILAAIAVLMAAGFWLIKRDQIASVPSRETKVVAPVLEAAEE